MTAHATPAATPRRLPLTPEQSNNYSLMSLIFGLLWLGGAGSVVAVILGHKVLNSMGETGERSPDKGMAIAGVVLGWIGVAALAVPVLFFVLFMTFAVTAGA